MDVDLSYGDLEVQSLRAVFTNNALVRTLNLSGNNIPSDVFINVMKDHVSHMRNLEELDVKNNKIGPDGAQYLCKSITQNCPRMRYVDLSENGILDESLVDVAHLLSDSCIETLFLVSCHITPRGVPTLCDGVLSSQHISSLSLAFNMLGDAGASYIARALSSHPALRSLDISDNRIGDVGAVDVAEHLILSHHSRLEWLVLSVNPIGDIGFSAIGEALARTRNPHLTHLDLGCSSNVGPGGRHAFIRHVRSMRYLFSLDLCSCNLSEEDAQNLRVAVLSPICGIESIEWYNNPGITLPTELALDAALKEKRSAKERRENHTRHICLTAASLFTAVMITYAASIILTRGRLKTK
uniref:Putative leucine-rich repeat protein (LRRP) n=1 Tax=Trypanosoma congolense (strain IL3000) TaxID=1068625 RepID=G0UNB3_TRYCI|nr:putative leucine-rich repeat protein (LRRP) [Trypanosoma congolense IL3000]